MPSLNIRVAVHEFLFIKNFMDHGRYHEKGVEEEAEKEGQKGREKTERARSRTKGRG